MEEEQYIEIEQNYAEQLNSGMSFPKIPKREIIYHANVAKIISLLNASKASTDSSGVTRIQHIIDEEDYRLELQTYIMNLVRKNLKKDLGIK